MARQEAARAAEAKALAPEHPRVSDGADGWVGAVGRSTHHAWRRPAEARAPSEPTPSEPSGPPDSGRKPLPSPPGPQLFGWAYIY